MISLCREQERGHNILFELNKPHKALSELVWTVCTIFISDECKSVIQKSSGLGYLCVYRVSMFIRFDIVCSLSVLIGSCSDTSSWNKIDYHHHENKKIFQLKASTEIRCECTQTVEGQGTCWRFRHVHARMRTDVDADECTQIHSCMKSWLMSQPLPGWLLLSRLMLGFSPEKVPSFAGPLTS